MNNRLLFKKRMYINPLSILTQFSFVFSNINSLLIFGSLFPPLYFYTGKSSVYRWPGHLAFKEKPAYYEKEHHVDGKNFTLAREAIDETFEHLKKDDTLNFMVVYLDQPDPVGHAWGANSSRV